MKFPNIVLEKERKKEIRKGRKEERKKEKLSLTNIFYT